MFLQLQVWALFFFRKPAHQLRPRVTCGTRWAGSPRLSSSSMFIMSAWSIGVMIDRLMAFNAARKQSRAFAPAVAGALREGKLDEAIKIADRYKKSHLAKVVVAGLQEFQAHQISAEIPGEEIEASKRALERAEAIVHAELKRGVSGSGHHRFHRLRSWVCSAPSSASSTRSRAFRPKSRPVSARSPAVFRKRSSPPLSVCSWPFPAVWMFNYFTSKLEAFDVEMGNSSSELIDYFLKRSQRGAGARK